MKAIITPVIACILGSAGAYALLNNEISSVREELRLRPPVLVVNQLKLASDFKDMPTEDEVRAFLLKINKAVAKFENAGYLILSSEHVVSAPNDLMLTVDDVNSITGE